MNWYARATRSRSRCRPRTAIRPGWLPAHLDLAREDAAGHIAFGYGPHACVGRRLGRAVLGIALETLVLGLPEPALDEPLEDIPLRARTPVLSVQRLPVRW
ncbi:cytochrome P450 [Streptomyces canarius]